MIRTNNRLKQFGFFAMALGATWALASDPVQASPDVQDTINKSFDFAADGRIALANINGDVKVTGCNCAKVSLSIKITANSQQERERISVDIKASTSSLKIATRYKDSQKGGKGRTSRVDYVLSVPNTVHFDGIELVNGNLDIRGVTGELDAELVNGDLKSDGVSSVFDVEQVNGNLDIRFTRASKTKAVDLSLVNGNMNVQFAAVPRVKSMDLSTVSGKIDLALPAGTNANIEAESVSGNLRNEFGIDVIKGKHVGSEMEGTIGKGGVAIELETVSGAIAVRRS